MGQQQIWVPQGLRGQVLFFVCARFYISWLKIAGQMRSWVSTTSDTDQV